MNESFGNVVTVVTPAAAEELSFVDLLIVLAKHKRVIIWFPLAVSVLTLAISFALPPVFRATTKMLPPQQSQSGAAALLSQLGGAASLVAGAAGLKDPTDLYVAMLKSRTVADALIKRFSLPRVYELESPEKVRRELEQRTSVNADKDGLISITVEDLDRTRAAKIANAYVDELGKLTKVLAVTQAGQRRMFFERQLELSKDKLAAAEGALKGSLFEHGVTSVDAESRGMLETIARLRAQISAKEIQIGAMKAFVTAQNVDFKRATEELESLKAELNRLENGRPGAAGGAKAEMTQVGFDSIKILRDVKYRQMLYELLAKQYEMARLEEANDPSIIQVLDPASEPESKFKPKRALITIIAGLAALVLAAIYAFVREGLAASIGTRDHVKWKRLRAHLTSGSRAG
jgi:tyrosine-protein kinase Etk/Wzc